MTTDAQERAVGSNTNRPQTTTRRQGRSAAEVACLLVGVGMAPVAVANPDLLSLPQHPAASVQLAWSPDDTRAPGDVLKVFVGTEATCGEDRVAMAGRYERTPEGLTFSPTFSFVAGTDYVARIQTALGAECVPFRLPVASAPPAAVVTDVFPSGETLPENTLRFYFHFSVPMAPHVALDHIVLRDASGAIDDAAFMRFKQELWSEDRTRLTVLVDPGRIKREVRTNVELGPALEAGKTYQLTVEGGWSSADGTSELKGFSRTFTVSSALRERPGVARWQVNSPCLGSREPLLLTFDRPFDRHRLRNSLTVVSDGREPVGGAAEVSRGERTWRFTPDKPWGGQNLQVEVDPTLEDIAGNNFQDLLDNVVSNAAQPTPNTSLPVRLSGCPEA